MGPRRAGRRVAAIAALVAVAVGAPSPAALRAETRPYGHVRVLATVPNPPGFPEGIAVRDGVVYVAGPATLGTIGKPPSRVAAFDRSTGALVRVYKTVGEDTSQEHANSSIAFDASGRLYVLNTQLGLFRLNPQTGAQEAYGSAFPDLKPCAPLVGPPPCSPNLADTPSIPNDLAFDASGSAYVTDSLQATIWRVPAGGGKPQIWFQDMRLASPYIGVNGIRINPAGTHVFLTVSIDLLGRSLVYRLPLVDQPKKASLMKFHQFPRGELADGIAFGATGLLYVAMATPTRSGIAILNAGGALVGRLGNRAHHPLSPYDSPANLAFDGDGAVLLSNHAFVSGVVLPKKFTVLDVWINDSGASLVTPNLA